MVSVNRNQQKCCEVDRGGTMKAILVIDIPDDVFIDDEWS